MPSRVPVKTLFVGRAERGKPRGHHPSRDSPINSLGGKGAQSAWILVNGKEVLLEQALRPAFAKSIAQNL